MATNSQLRLEKVPSAFAAIGEKHNALVDVIRTMTGTGACNVVFSEGKIIISVPTVSSSGIPDPLTLNTFNGTNFNGGTFNGSLNGNASTVTNGVYTTDTGTVTNTMLAGGIANGKLQNSNVTIGSTSVSLGSSTSSLSGLSSVSSSSFTGSLTGNASTVTNGVYTTDTGTVTNAMLAGGIENAKLQKSDVTIGTTLITLGSTASSLTGLSSVSSSSFTGNLTGNASTVTNGVYTTDTGTVTNTMLAGNITNGKLQNSSIQLGSSSVSLGGSLGTISGLTSVNSTNLSGTLSGDVNGNVTGNLQTTSGAWPQTNVTSTAITVQGSISAEYSQLNKNELFVSKQYFSAAYKPDKIQIDNVLATHSVVIDSSSLSSFNLYGDNNGWSVVKAAYEYSYIDNNGFVNLNNSAKVSVSASQIYLTSNSGSTNLNILASALTHSMAIKEIDVCSSGAPKKMLVVSSDPY